MGKMGKFKCKGLKDFQKELEKLQPPDEFVEACAKELAARMLRMVIKRTPVGNPPQDINENRKTTVEAVGESGKKKKFLSREASIYQQYWSGYEGGTLRRGWISKTQKEAENNKSAPQATEILEYVNGMQVSRSGGVYKIEIINPVRYASYVEYGHRQSPGKYVPALGKQLKKGWVPGQRMMTISEQELEHIAPQVLERKIKKYLEGIIK